MFTVLKYTLILALVSVLVLFIAPLVLFIHGVLENPECIGLEIRPLEQVNESAVRVVLEVSYCSGIPLKDFKVQLGNQEVDIESVETGRVSKEVVLSRSDLETGVVRIEFKIGGLYKMVLKYG